jgi:hypothetical protein
MSKDLTYTIDQAKSNAKAYRDYFIGTMSLYGDSRFVTFLFDKNLQEVDSSICNVKEMKEYVDEFIYKEVTK